MEIITFLIDKIKSWTPAAADKFHNNSLRNTKSGESIWDHDSSGFYNYCSNAATYFSNNGTIHKLTTQGCYRDWKSHTILYEISKRNNDITIEIPQF